MSILQPWNIAFAIGFIVYVVSRGRFASRTRFNEITERRVTAREWILLPAMFISGLLLPVIYLFTPLLSFADYQLPTWIHWIGLAFMIVGLWLFYRSHADLGLNWSATLELRIGHEVVKHGVYRLIRHPMYAAIWLFSFAQAMLLDNWLAGWAVVVVFACMYFLRVPREEQLMLDRFGDSYRDYMSATGRLFPKMLDPN